MSLGVASVHIDGAWLLYSFDFCLFFIFFDTHSYMFIAGYTRLTIVEGKSIFISK